jgi:hypothetical protein
MKSLASDSLRRLTAFFFVVVLILLFAVPSALPFDKEFGKLAFPESGYNEDIALSYITISACGTGYGLLPTWNEEAQRPEWEWGLGVWQAGGSGFVVRGNYVITAAHVVVPEVVTIKTGSATYWQVLMRQLDSRMIYAASWGRQGPPLDVVYINEEQDVALLKFRHPRIPFKESPIRLSFTVTVVPMPFGFVKLDAIGVGDAICMIVHKRDSESGNITWTYELRRGKVRDSRPSVPEGYEWILPVFSMSDFTMDLEVIPGDSGSAVIAFDRGEPVIIGVARALLNHPSEHWSYAARIDVLVPFLWAAR